MEPLFAYSQDPTQAAAQEAKKKRAEERQKEHQARLEEALRLREIKKAERQAKHAELLRMHDVNREQKRLRKEENVKKYQKMLEEKQSRHIREFIGTVDRKALVDAFSQAFAKYGPIEDVSIGRISPAKSSEWSIHVVFKKKEDAVKARGQTVLSVPTAFQLEPRAISEWSVYFPFLWMPEGAEPATKAESPPSEEKTYRRRRRRRRNRRRAYRNEFRPTGKSWDDLKKEIARVFTSKITGSKIHVITYRYANIVVCFDSHESQVKALELSPQTPLVIGGKQIPTLVQGLPKPIGQKRKKTGKKEEKTEEPPPPATSGSTTTDTSQPMKIART